MKKLRICFVSLLVAVLAASCSLAQESPTPVKVGTLFSYTGSLAEFGPPIRNGTVLAAEQLNKAAEAVFGGPIIELVHEDAATNPATASDRARKLVNIDDVVAIVGALSSGVTVAVAESVTIPAAVIQVSPASTTPLMTVMDDNDFLFRTTASDAAQGIVAAKLARGAIAAEGVPEGYGFDTAATIYVNNPYGQGLSQGFAEAFEDRGGEVLAQVAVPGEPQPTYASQLQQALANNPDVLLVLTYPGQATVLLAESRDLYDYTSWQFADGGKSLELIEALGAETLNGKLGTAGGSDPERAGSQHFTEAYEAKFGERPPLPFIDTSYDATSVIGLAVAKAMLDGLSGEEVDGAAIRDRLRFVAGPPGQTVGVGEFAKALELLQAGQDIDYSGAAGEVNFDENGDVITPFEVWKFVGDNIETVTVLGEEEILAE